MAAELNLTIEQAASFTRVVAIQNAGATAYNLTSCVVEAQARGEFNSGSIPDCDFTITYAADRTTGLVRINLTYTQTADTSFRKILYWDMLLTDANGKKIRLVEGGVEVTAATTLSDDDTAEAAPAAPTVSDDVDITIVLTEPVSATVGTSLATDTAAVHYSADSGKTTAQKLQARTNIGAEASLGNPSVSGYVLSSTTAGVRSWTASGGGGDVTLAGPNPFTGASNTFGGLQIDATQGLVLPTGDLTGASGYVGTADAGVTLSLGNGTSDISLATGMLTGPWEFTGTAETPLLYLSASGATIGALNIAEDSTVGYGHPGHYFLTCGINMEANGATGYSVIDGADEAWGFMLERSYLVTSLSDDARGTVQSEGYLTDGGSFRPFQFGYATTITATVTGITSPGTNAVVAFTPPSITDFLTDADGNTLVGLRFKFTALSGASGISTETWYYVASKSGNTFTFATSYANALAGTPLVDGTATSGTMQRGGYGLTNVQTGLIVYPQSYDHPETAASGAAMEIRSNNSSYPTAIKLTNYTTGGSYISYNNLWRAGEGTAAGGTAGHFVISQLSSGAKPWFQINPIGANPTGRVAIGYATATAAASELDVNGTVTATAFSGSGASLTSVNAATFSTATESSDTTCFPIFVTASGTQTLAGKTNAAFTFNSATSTLGATSGAFTQLLDTNGNELVKFVTTASAINEITVTNGAAGGAAVIAATGGDTSVDLHLQAKGTGGAVDLYVNGGALVSVTPSDGVIFNTFIDATGLSITGAAGSFTTLAASTSVTTPLITSSAVNTVVKLASTKKLRLLRSDDVDLMNADESGYVYSYGFFAGNGTSNTGRGLLSGGLFLVTADAIGWNSDTYTSRKSAGIVRFGTSSSNSSGSWEATNGTLLGTLAVTGASTLTGNLTSNGALISTPQAISGTGAITAINVTTLSTTIAATGISTTTLAAGTNGQIKVLTMIQAAGACTVTVTNASWGGATTAVFDTVGDTLTLHYVNSTWMPISNIGVVLA